MKAAPHLLHSLRLTLMCSERRMPSTLCALVFCSMVMCSATAEEVYIDLDFTRDSSQLVEGADLVAQEPFGQPLQMPTSVNVAGTSSVRFMRSEIDPDQYEAKFDIQSRPNTTNVPENVSIAWDLRDFQLQKGVYELTYHLRLISEPNRGARLGINLADPSGDRIPTEQPVHASQRMILSINEQGGIGWRGERLQMFPGTLMEVRVLIDMDRHVWSAFLDGEQILFEAPMPKQILEVQPQPILSRIFLGSEAGLGDRAPFEYALAKLRLVRISE